jgi:uncharacterized protein
MAIVKNILQRPWSPYIVGLGLGLLSWLTFGFMGHLLGTSTTFVRLAALFWRVVNPAHLNNSMYYNCYLSEQSWINWQFAVLIGLFVGALLARKLSGAKRAPFVPELWSKGFGRSPLRRVIGAFVGGIFVMFGARLAGGCASGHGLTGGMQFALSGWLFMVGLFGVGIPVALLLYSRSSK